MSDVLAAAVAVTVVVGAVVGEHLGPSPGGWCLLGGGAGLVAALGARFHRRAGAWAFLALALGSSALMQRALDGLEGPLAQLAARHPDVVAAIRLREDPRRTRWNARAMAEVVSYRADCHGGRSGCGSGGGSLVAPSLVVVVGHGSAAQRLGLMSAGETAVLHGRLRPLGGAERRLRWRHAAAVIAADDLLGAAPPAGTVMQMANGLRGLVLSGARRMPDTPAGLTAGLLVGDDRDLPAPVAEDFRAAGLSHLLAVSGANVALVLALAGPALRRLGLAGRFAGGLAVVSLFAAMARFEPSVLRASAMAGVALVAAYAGRPAHGRRLLALAVTGLVLADPFLIHSLGFQLSVAASGGILVLARPLAGRIPGPPLVRTGLAVTAAAQVGVAPVALPAFGSLPLIALPANLLAAPAAAGLTLWGFGSGLVGGLLEPILPVVPDVLAVPTGLLASYLAGLASLAARAPMPVGPGVAWAGLAVSALALGVSRRPGRSGRHGPDASPRFRAGRRGTGDPAP